MNSYQRLQKKNEKLRQEYRELFQKFYNYLKDPESYENVCVAFDITSQGRLSEMFLYGERNGYNANGLLEAISKSEPSNTFSWNVMDRKREGDKDAK